MVVVYLPRSAWTSVPKPAALMPLFPGEVDGDAQHWPGIDPGVSPDYKFAGRSQKQIATYLEGIRRYHTGVRGWQDIAYLQAIDPAGRVWDLRGMEHRSAANGDTGPNRNYGATLWLVGPNEEPTDAQVAAYQTWRVEKWLRRYPDAVQVKRHSDVRPDGTACPGPHVGALVTSGTLEQPPEDDVQLDAEDRAWIAKTIDDALAPLKASVLAGPKNTWAFPVTGITNSDGKELSTETVLANTFKSSVLAAKGATSPAQVVLTAEQVEDIQRTLATSVAAVLERTTFHVD
jgi:hypothetical protein